jgi:shikimate kinase
MKIFIIGFMGAGKSVVAKKLAQRLNMNFVDMDEEIENNLKMNISDIFKLYGENYFRIKEAKLLKELSKKDNIIISTGGGIVSQSENCKLLKMQKNVVFLDANVNTIIKNTSNQIDKRPLLRDSLNIEKTIKTLLNKRYDNYKKCSSINIDVNNKNIEEVVDQILVYIS